MPARVTPPIRVGVLSFAMYHANFWIQAIRESELAALAGIWDDDAKRGAEAARTYDTAFRPSLDELLGECDAVCITSETARHPRAGRTSGRARVPYSVRETDCHHP